VTLVAFEWFCQINILPNPLFQQIAKYYIRLLENRSLNKLKDVVA